eukprot:PhF_6_TR27324/c0_g1_i1/m.40136
MRKWGSVVSSGGVLLRRIAVFKCMSCRDLPSLTLIGILWSQCRFFLTTGTALVFYIWFLWKKEEHTYQRFDLAMLPRSIRKTYSKAGFDYTRWKTVHARMAEIEEELMKTEDWKNRNV